MAVCENCGREFDVSDAKWDFDHSFGKGAYEEHYPYHDMCGECAIEETLDSESAGAETISLMGSGWDWD